LSLLLVTCRVKKVGGGPLHPKRGLPGRRSPTPLCVGKYSGLQAPDPGVCEAQKAGRKPQLAGENAALGY
jgi:hypothetical protein